MGQRSDPQKKYLKLARGHFADKGYHGTSLSDVAKHANVSKQALLHFFKTKDRLYEAVLSDLSGELLADIDIALGDTPGQRLVSYFDSLLDSCDGREDTAKLVIRTLTDTDPCSDTQPLKPFLDRLLELAQQTERWKDVPKDVVMAHIYRLIGTVQFFQLSRKTLAAMYGSDPLHRMEDALKRDVRASVRSFVSFA